MKRGPYKNSFLSKLLSLPREEVERVLRECRSIRQACEKLGLKLSGSAYGAFQTFVLESGIDISHFPGKGWLSGQSHPCKFAASDILVFGKLQSRMLIKRSLEERGRKYECEICKQGPLYMGKELVLPIDHIDGNAKNNLENNLRFLCPNCHTQTETWGFKNSRKSSRRFARVT